MITICQELQDTAVATGAGDRAILIENVMGGDVDAATSVSVREQWRISASTPLVLYTGTFEAYQGLELLYGVAARLKTTHPEARVLIVGGAPKQVTPARARAERDGLPIIFTGSRPAREIASFVAACDILVSPRITGTNTPLRVTPISGPAGRSSRPICARTHKCSQPGTAVLVPPDPTAFAAAVGTAHRRSCRTRARGGGGRGVGGAQVQPGILRRADT